MRLHFARSNSSNVADMILEWSTQIYYPSAKLSAKSPSHSLHEMPAAGMGKAVKIVLGKSYSHDGDYVTQIELDHSVIVST